MRSFLTLSLLSVFVASSASGQTATRNWKDRAEYNLCRRISQGPNTGEKLSLLLEWKRLYPDSDFRQLRQEWLVQAYDTAGQAEETFAAARELFESDPSSFVAGRALCYWAPRLKNPPGDAAGIVKKAATQMLARLDDILPGYSTRRNLDSLLEGIETGQPAKTERVSNQEQKDQRAEAERIARQALDWAANRAQPRP
jgi:hypothetical protein